MARSLQVNVQIDQLPDISGDQRSYVGARLSAWIDGPDQALPTDWHMLVPWEWSTAGTNVPGSWNPGDPASWIAWWVDPTQTPPRVVNAAVAPVVNPDSLTPPPDAWKTPRDQMLISLASDHRSMEAPPKSTDPLRPAPISDQTVFGFVESLSSFPAPLPEMHKVWTCLRVDTPRPATSSELVVVPVFATCVPLVAPSSYKTPAPPALQGSVADHVWTVAYAAVAAPGISGVAVIDRLVEANKVGSRILLKDKFLVGGAKGWALVVGQDWMVQLPAQLAGILDPAKGFSQALEQALGQYGANLVVANRTPAAKQTKAQQDLLSVVLPVTPGQRSALRLLLGVAYWRVLASSATGTRAAAPLPVVFARSNYSSDNQNFLAGLTARDAARDPAALDATIPGFMTVEQPLVLSDTRLMALLGQSADTKGPSEPPGVDTPEGLSAFLLSHWQNTAASAGTLTSTPTPLMRFNATRWNGHQVVADPDGDFGLFDLTALGSASSAASSASVSFGLNTSHANAVIVVSLLFDGYPKAIATVQTDPIATAGAHKLTITVAPPPLPAPAVAPALPHVGAAASPPAPPPAPPRPSFQISIDGGPAKAVNFDEAALFKRRASILLQLTPGGPSVTVVAQPITKDVVQKLLDSMSEPALRASATLVHSAPYIPLILAGTKHDGTSASGSPTDVIALALADWAEYRLGAECDEAIRVAEALAPLSPQSPIGPVALADIQKVEPLFRYVRDVAIENAKAKARNLFAAFVSDGAGYELSAKATPVVFPIDQPQPIANTQDIWAMFAGAGVLVGVSNKRDPWPASDIWYSLNLASMYVPPVNPTTHIRASLKGLQPITPGEFDPVPLQIGEVGGVRAANLSYENRSLVGEMPHDPVHTSSTPAPAMPRRLEAYGFPEARAGKGPKLPALCFGKRYYFLPYLIGHGGSLAVFLRDPSNYAVATRLRPKNSIIADGRSTPDPSARLTFTSKALDDYLAGVTDDVTGLPVTYEDCVRFEDYERTPPVGAPRIYGEKALPGVPDGVEALASEIPIGPAAITLAAGETAFFYRNQERTEGTLDFSSADPLERAIQIDFAGLPKGDDQSPRPALQVIVKARSGDKPLPPITIAQNDWPGDSSRGVRIIAGRYGIEIFSQSAPGDIFVERPPRFGAPRTIDPQPVDFTNWQAFSVAISNGSAADITLIPPVVSIGTSQGTDHQLTDGRQVPLPEMSHQKRVITLLDGIQPALASLSGVAIRVRRPTVEFNTFERWINWDLEDPDIKESLDLAHKMLVLEGPKAEDDVTIDDPAVERVVVELVELFPDPHLHGRAPMGADWSAKSAIINGYKTNRAEDPRLPIRVAKPDDGRGAVEQAGLSKNPDGSAKEVILAPGGVYEVRFYGAVPEDKQGFSVSLPACGIRFGKGAWQGLRKFTLSGKKYRLGTPLVRTFEVATDGMPALFDAHSNAPMSIDRRLALNGSGDRALATLGHDFVLSSYPKIRYVNQVLLLSQRWGWRGLPLGTLPVATDFGERVSTAPRPMPGFSSLVEDHGRRLAVQTLKDFESIAFIGRRDADIGVIDETKLHLAHVLPPVDDSGVIRPEAADTRPPVFAKDLLYSGGASWWRFALAATSRYAAMKPGLDLTRYSHIDPSAPLNAHWHTLIVRDRETGRRPKRPGLLLVLPLTEKLMSDVAVPPLLAIFSEPMFSGFHVGDGVEAAIDYARHPLPGAPIVWTDVDRARDLTAKIAAKYAAFANDTTSSANRQALREAFATFNAFARSQGVVFATANLAKAQKNVDDANAALNQALQKPTPPAQLQALRDALDLANSDKKDASEALDKARKADLAAQNQLKSVQQGSNEQLVDVQAEMQRYWPQIGPDPILTSAAHSGRPVPIRLDGPIGYTFDLETEAPRFGRSGFLATPISASNGAVGVDLGITALADIQIRPWTLARLRFRRLEAVELSLYKPVPLSDKGGPASLLLSSEAIDLSKAQSKPAVAALVAPAPPPKVPVPPAQPPIVAPLVPPEYHEGLSIDFPELDESGADATVRVLKGAVTNAPPADPPPWSERYVHVSATVTSGALSILLNTDLGPAGTYDVPLRPTTRIWLRLVLSQREKPEQSQKPYEPVLDVSVRLLLDDGDGDGLARSQAGAWVTVACLPLLAGGKTFRPSDPVYVNVTQAPDAPAAQATGVRLTPFTAPVWCQFTQDVSTFNVTTTAQTNSQSCTVGDLSATMDSKKALKLGLVVDAAGTSQPLHSIEWLPRDTASQIRCSVAAVVTEFISDAFDRVRERPLAVYRIDDGANQSDPATMQCIWPTSPQDLDFVAKTKLTGARVRLITLMHLQLDTQQAARPPASLADYFSEPFQSDIDMNASDASGRILGVSKPIEVTLGS